MSKYLIMSCSYSDGWLPPPEGIFRNQRIYNWVILQHFPHEMK